MGYREDIIRFAKYWAEPGVYPPSPGDFAWLCEYARLNQQPSHADLEYTRRSMPNGDLCIGGGGKSWCGIFAVAVWNWAGIGVKWNLNWGKTSPSIQHYPGLDWEKRNTSSGIRPGDIAYIEKRKHHYIVTDVGDVHVCSVDGNQEGNTIREYTWFHLLSSIVCYYTIKD